MTRLSAFNKSKTNQILNLFTKKGRSTAVSIGCIMGAVFLLSACTAIPDELIQNLQNTILPSLEIYPGADQTSTPEAVEPILTATPTISPSRAVTEDVSDFEEAEGKKTTPTVIHTPTAASQVLAPEPLTDTIPEYGETSDLLYLDEDKLMRWDHITNYSSMLIDGISEYDVSQSGNQIAVLKKMKVTADGQEIFNLGVFDFKTKQLNYLVESVAGMFGVSISPDGKLILFNKESPTGEITIVKNEPDPNPEVLGICIGSQNEDCNEFSWSPDSQKIIWRNPNGIWLADVTDLPGFLLHPNKITVTDPKGAEEEIEVEFGSFIWSPQSRFVLLDVIPSDYGVRWQGILDSNSGQIVRVPQSIDYSELDACANWTMEGDLLVGHSAPEEESAPQIEIWEIMPTKAELLVRQNEIQLDSGIYPSMSSNEDGENVFFPNWLNQVNDTTFNFGLCHVKSTLAPILYQLDIKQNKLKEIVVIPNNSTDIIWSPDGLGALIMGMDGEVLYAPFNGSLMRDLREILGQSAREFKWLPPKPRI
jgi:hypothetical protein